MRSRIIRGFSWPGLKANDHLSRVVTREVKEAKELEENEAWAESLISRVLDYVPARTVIELVKRQSGRYERLITGSGGWLRSSGCRGRRRGGGRREDDEGDKAVGALLAPDVEDDDFGNADEEEAETRERKLRSATIRAKRKAATASRPQPMVTRAFGDFVEDEDGDEESWEKEIDCSGRRRRSERLTERSLVEKGLERAAAKRSRRGRRRPGRGRGARRQWRHRPSGQSCQGSWDECRP